MTRGDGWIAPLALALGLALAGVLLGCPADDDDGDDDDASGPDADGDGFVADDDCDDLDDTIHPGADEIADGIDNDCDGTADTAFVCADGGVEFTSLQAALDDVPADMTVRVCPGSYTGPLALDGKRLTVVAEGGAEVTEVITAAGSAWAVTDVTGTGAVIDGFAIRGGLAEALGGGIRCERSTLTLRGCVVEGNASAGDGGGLGAAGCRLTVVDSVFSGNTAAASGGGVSLAECSGTFEGNRLDGNAAADGGGLAVALGSIEVVGNAVLDNDATSLADFGGGGGVWLSGAAPLLGNTVSGNRALRFGAGIYLHDATAEVSGNLVSGNVADEDGGGIYAYFGGGTAIDNRVEGNEAGDDAGGLRAMAGAWVIEDCAFVDNVAGDDGGGVKLSHAAGSFAGNVLEGNVAGDAGGGLALDNDVTPVDGCTFAGNLARRGGGLYAADGEGAALLVVGSTFDGNQAEECGGGLLIEDQAVGATLRQLAATGNLAGRGGALCFADADVVAGNVLLTGNEAVGLGGGAVFYRGTLSLSYLTAADNAAADGAALALDAVADATVAGVILASNHDAPAVWIDGASPAWTHNDVFDHPAGPFDGMDDPTGADGNLAEDPLFLDAAAGDHHLQPASPCVDAGPPDETDADGSRADMGAFGGPYGAW